MNSCEKPFSVFGLVWKLSAAAFWLWLLYFLAFREMAGEIARLFR